MDWSHALANSYRSNQRISFSSCFEKASTYLLFSTTTLLLPANIMGESQGWSHNICSMSDCSSCCGTFWCGSCIYGRTAWRMKNFPDHPSSSDGLDWLNGHCLGMFAGLVLGVPCIPVWLQRHAVRKQFNLSGNGCTDCLTSVFCSCCAQAQHENELKAQAEKQRLIISAPPSSQQPMVYVPQHAPTPQQNVASPSNQIS